MIKGVCKNMVSVKGIKGSVIEEAIFIVNPEKAKKQTPDNETLLRDIIKILHNETNLNDINEIIIKKRKNII